MLLYSITRYHFNEIFYIKITNLLREKSFLIKNHKQQITKDIQKIVSFHFPNPLD